VNYDFKVLLSKPKFKRRLLFYKHLRNNPALRYLEKNMEHRKKNVAQFDQYQMEVRESNLT
jgi:hypothetical protein